MELSRGELTKRLEATLLAPFATNAQILEVAEQAQEDGCRAVCIQPHFITLTLDILEDSDTLVVTVHEYLNRAESHEARVETIMLLEDTGAEELQSVVKTHLPS